MNRIGGGVAIYVREGIIASERVDLAITGLEALWLELIVNKRKIILGGIYRPPDSNNNHWLLLEQSIDQAFNQSCDNILVTGDFNINVLNTTSNKITNLMASYNAEQLITLPTHFTEHSNSLIDLMFVKNTNQVISSFVADPFIPNLTRFHCPVVAVLKLDKPKHTSFKRKIWLYDRGNYDDYRAKLQATNWETLMDSNDLEKVTQDITESILSAASESIPNKVVTIRPNNIPWLNTKLRKLIRKRNKIHKRAKKSNTVESWATFRQVRNEVTNQIHKAKLDYQNELIEKVNSSNISAKSWFKTAKQLTHKQTSKTIPTLYEGNMEASTDQGKVELLNQYQNRPLPHSQMLTNSSLSNITVTPQDVKDALTLIDPSKASGPDLVSPKLLREGTSALSEPLSKFLTNY
ncbi:uncharacterized protein LOC123530276 [Mercenaria mercenaria]|uniref:uncharacterized protein LOC123530276 n=1 Tax=Mercenaria mercenaria TaxID=6596 RepID=UPI00234E9067|nr:uncharacterized protein LOC123530276 [Mercenaria mercenaria]